MTTRTRPRAILAETLRPERVDANGRPEVITGDAPPEGPSNPPQGPPPAPAPTEPPPTSSAPPPAPAPVTGSDTPPPPAPAPVAAGVTTGEILAALGLEATPRVHVTREPSPYLEAGGRISERFGFFSDLYAAGVRGDTEARRRAAQFQSQLRDYIAAAATTTSSADIVPPAWGGQWYVDQLAQLRPAVSAFTSATITDPRPIPVPRFKDTTPSALVGDHVEGQPDTPGTVNFDQVTVTPKAKSGRAEVSRELVDASPQLTDSVVSSALRESYSQITESTMCGVLEAGALAGPPGGATAVSTEQAIRAALGALPGTRFMPARVILPSSHVWSALVGADGPDGRPLFPYLLNGPTNAAGTTGAGYATGNIAGVETRPTWGLSAGATIIGAGPTDAMSFESSLLEFRFEEKNGPELIEFDVWGYFAAVVLQRKGVILVTSTATAGDLGEMSADTDSSDRDSSDKGEKNGGTSSRGK